MINSEWTKQTYDLDYLKVQALLHPTVSSAMGFLREIGVVRGPWGRRNAIPRTNLDRTAIPAGYLAEVALGWDDLGPSEPTDFVSALEFEVNDTTKNDMVREVISSLGRDDCE